MAPAGFTVTIGNRLEGLLPPFADAVAHAALPPLTPLHVLVPSRAVGDWLTLQLARRHGIAADLRCLQPFELLLHVAGIGTRAGARRQELLWRILHLLDAPDAARRHAAAARYCGTDARKRYQLSRRLANLFEQYQLHRPDLLAAWQRGEQPVEHAHAGWQQSLWRDLTGTGDSRQRGLFEAVPDATADGCAVELARRRVASAAAADLPVPLFAFGIGSLPPALLDLLVALSGRGPVALFALLPTRAPLHPGRIEQAGNHELLARLGAASRVFFDQLVDRDPGHGFAECFVAEDRPDLLSRLQQELLDNEPAVTPSPGDGLADDSLRVHGCHSPLREMQVVLDQILAAQRDGVFTRLDEVLVLVPDIQAYAPHIRSVFDPLRDRLPHHIADRDPALARPMVAAVLGALELATSRVSVFDVCHLLDEPTVHRRFGLVAADLSPLREALHRVRVRWGLDAEHRAALGLPTEELHSFAHGVQRLLVGLATGPEHRLVAGVLPDGGATGALAATLARFCDYLLVLRELVRRLHAPQTLRSFAETFDWLVQNLLADEHDDASARDHLLAAGRQLREAAELAPTASLPARVCIEHLRHWCRSAGEQQDLITGRITFAALQPMRALPCRLLCIAGLGDRAFPRRDPALAFDLIAALPRPGDRNRTLDDRQMFLDCLHAAQRRLVLTYVSRSQKDDSIRAPSLVISELLQYCMRRDGGRSHRFVQHPLQAFSPRYLSGEDRRLFTHSTAAAAVPAPALTPLLDGQLAPAPDEQPLSLDDLLSFWRHPCRWFLRRRLGMYLDFDEGGEDDSEPFALDALTRYQMADPSLQRRIHGEADPYADFAIARASGLLPHGTLGRSIHAGLQHSARTFAALAAPHPPRRLTAVIEVAGAPLHVSFDNLQPGALHLARYALIKPKDRVAALLQHLCLLRARRAGHDLPDRTVLFGTAGQEALAELDPALADAALARFVSWFHAGQTRPLPFFPATSWEYHAQIAKSAAPERALNAARDRHRSERDAGDGLDAWNRIAFRDLDPLEHADFGPLTALFDPWPVPARKPRGRP